MKKYESGFSVVHVLLVLVVVGIIGFTGWWVYKTNKDTTKTLSNTAQGAGEAEKSTKKSEEKKSSNETPKIPDDWVWYENDFEKIKIAYPKSWQKMSGFTNNLAVIDKPKAVVNQGCADPACQIKYDTQKQAWYGTNLKDEIKPVASSGSLEAFVITGKGEMNCGSFYLFISYPDKFVTSVMSLCEDSSDVGSFAPTDTQLSYSKVASDLKESLKTFTVIK